jgi:hypothetical protein
MVNTAKGDPRGVTGPADLAKERQLRDFRRLNGLCFGCGEKYEPGHQAKCLKRGGAQLHNLTIEDMGLVLSDEMLQQLDQEDKKVEETYKLSINAISGTDRENCMRIRALIQNQVLVMLVDSGSSSSFVSQRMVDQLALSTEVVSPVRVKVANGEFMLSSKRVAALEWWVEGHTYASNMRILDLEAYDAILGYDWLKSHSPMECDWDNKVLTFWDKGVRVQLKGDGVGSTEVLQVSAVQLSRWMKGNEVWAFVMLEAMQEEGAEKEQEPLRQILKEFEDVFAVTTRLPLVRMYDHHIPLLPGSIPMNSRPYRYSPFHKT